MAELERPAQTRQEKAVAWAATHAGELAGVGAPLIGGAVWSPWLCLLAVPGTAAWVASELRLRRTTRTARTSITTTGAPALTTAPAEHEQQSTGDGDQIAATGSPERKEAHR
ncbi:conjugal transfer protein TraH [Amycolatopsis sp. NPDC102389]|uniref:conjugal transfer protein TraH n=1 Tax=Amycolatopsis sp. NPDC102389 TaxID=3363941 RepID=UPI0037F105BB